MYRLVFLAARSVSRVPCRVSDSDDSPWHRMRRRLSSITPLWTRRRRGGGGGRKGVPPHPRYAPPPLHPYAAPHIEVSGARRHGPGEGGYGIW